MYKNRIAAPLTKSLKQGKRFFLFYGNGIKDNFLEDFYTGISSLQESLKLFFLNYDNCDVFAVVNTDGVQVFKKNNNGIEDISNNYLTLGTKEDSQIQFNDDEGETDEENSNAETSRQIEKLKKQIEEKDRRIKTLEEQVQKTNVSILNHLGIVRQKAQEKNESSKKTVIFFEDFEWLAKLYSSNNNESLEYIKSLKDFYKTDECYTVVSLEDVELLKKYNFETKGSNIIFLGNPSAEEVKYSYLLKFLGKTNFENKNIQLDLFDELKNISQAISSSKKSLREALQVFDTIVLEQKRTELKSKDFEDAIEKITAEKVTMKDIIIEDEERNRVINAVEAFMDSKDTRDYRKGFILTGPPGTGKTQLVKALANEYNCYFMAPKLSDLKGEYVGQTSGKVKRIFDEARANAPTIMFIDEADTVFPSRDIGIGSDSYNLDMVNQFLQEIEGMTTGKEKIFVIAATNRPNIIDAAIQSRLTERIHIGLPSAENRIRIFNKKLERHNFTLDGKRYLNEIQSKTVNMSGRDIENYVKKLKEHILDTPFKKIENLRDDEESRKILLEVLKSNEETLIEDLQKSVPVDVKEPDKISMGTDGIIGYNEIKNRISKQAQFIKYSEAERLRAHKFGVKVSKGVLLYGPPGNAKTTLAQAVAKENNFYFVKVLSKDFTSDSITKQLDNLQVIFNQTVRLSKMCSEHDGVVLFFDEFDALAMKNMNQVVRGTLLDYLASGENQKDENQEDSGVRSPQSRILLIAATNYQEKLDPAVVRKGRIDVHLFMDNPTEENGTAMLQKIFDDDNVIQVEKGVNIKTLYENLTKHVQAQHPRKEDESLKNVRPSGADIIKLYEELKAEAYFEQVSSDEDFKEDKVLKLTQKIVDDYFCNLGV